MYQFGFVVIIALFLTLLFLNFYFRVKVLKHYKILVKNKVQFDAKWILKKDKIENEVIPRYPAQANAIRLFTQNIRNSIKIAVVLVILITMMGYILLQMK